VCRQPGIPDRIMPPVRENWYNNWYNNTGNFFCKRKWWPINRSPTFPLHLVDLCPLHDRVLAYIKLLVTADDVIFAGGLDIIRVSCG
jgi:hypothetical protein